MYTIDKDTAIYKSEQIDVREVLTSIKVAVYHNNKLLYWKEFLGRATCHPYDTFNYTIGVIVSTMRAEKAITDFLFEKNLNLF